MTTIATLIQADATTTMPTAGDIDNRYRTILRVGNRNRTENIRTSLAGSAHGPVQIRYESEICCTAAAGLTRKKTRNRMTKPTG